MAKVVALAMLAVLLFVGGSRDVTNVAATQTSNPDQAYMGFGFVAGTCELGAAFCADSVPREWTANEVDLIRSALDEIASNPLGKTLIARAQGNGFVTLRRYVLAVLANPQTRQYEPSPLSSAYARNDYENGIKSINIANLYFSRVGARDAFSGTPGYELTTHVLLHELIHGVDLNQQYSAAPEFTKLINGIRYSKTQLQEYLNLGDPINALVAKNDLEGAWRLGRRSAEILNWQLPSRRAFDEGGREAFAEIGAHLVLDPNTRARLPSHFVEYFERVVNQR